MLTLYHPESDSHHTARAWTDLDANRNADNASVVVVNPTTIRLGTQIAAGPGFSTVYADLDFEVYSEAGFEFVPEKLAWRPAGNANKGGIFAVGSVVYAQHPTTELLSLAYNLKDGHGSRLWLPGQPPPLPLFQFIARGEPFEAWNVSFEYYIWKYVCEERLGWPPLPIDQLRCAMAKARAFALPGKLEKAAEVTEITEQKLDAGKALIKFFCQPRAATKKRFALRNYPADFPEKAAELYQYNEQDIAAEAGVSAVTPDLNPTELGFWQYTLMMNARGVGVDVDAVEACIEIIRQALIKYDAELNQITGGAVAGVSKIQDLTKWVATRGVLTDSLDADHIEKILENPLLPPDVRRALEIRQAAGSAGVKKVYAMARQCARGERLHELFIYHGARTGRDTGADVQPQNLVKAGPALSWCEDMTCQKPYAQELTVCPHCGADGADSRPSGWSWKATEEVLAAIRTRSLTTVEQRFGNAILAISGCIRGLFVPALGKDFVCSDFSSIEAVVTAVLAGEQWRIEAFRKKEDIYLVSAGRITGLSLEDYAAHKASMGENHSDRQKIGKPAELGLGFGGWIGAWRQFDKTDNFTDEEVKRNIMAWRDASPAIVEMWGGQVRGKPWRPTSQELFGYEGAAIKAILHPGECFTTHQVTFGVKDDILYLKLPSGRFLTYHKPRLHNSTRWEGQLEITFEGWNSNPKMGPMGWISIKTYGGRLAENIIQATARDIMGFTACAAEKRGYPIVLRVHDELVAEVPEGFGSIAELEEIMGTLPDWAAGWPIRAAGGWRAKRYRKD